MDLFVGKIHKFMVKVAAVQYLQKTAVVTAHRVLTMMGVHAGETLKSITRRCMAEVWEN